MSKKKPSYTITPDTPLGSAALRFLASIQEQQRTGEPEELRKKATEIAEWVDPPKPTKKKTRPKKEEA